MKKQNILFILTDDQRFDMIGCHKNSFVKTPNLDELAKRGVYFSNAHIPGGNSDAICMPSRAMINTGRDLQNIHLDGRCIPLEHTTLPEYLRANNYKTYGVGKWHNGKESYHRSFDNGGCIFFGGMWDHWNVPCYNFHTDGDYSNTIPYCYNWFKSNEVSYRDADYIATGIHSSELFTNKAIELLEAHNRDEKFYMYIAYLAPHDPRTMPQQFKDMYPAKDVALPENYSNEYQFDSGIRHVRDEELAQYPRIDSEIKEHISDYCAMVTHLDSHIGRIIQYLKDNNLYDNTIIILAGDNGLAVGEHGLMGKQNLHEHSIRIPLLVSGPEILQAKESNSQVYLCDIYPSLCEHLNLEIPASVNGISFAKELISSEVVSRKELYLSYFDIIRGLKSDNWKLIEYATKEGERYTQLYNLSEDEYETVNLAYEKDYLDKVNSMRTRLIELSEVNGDIKTLWGETYWDKFNKKL